MDKNLTTPLVSVIMPIYNCESYLTDAIESILGQTLVDFEFIIIDDGSTDSSAQVVESYNDSRIRFKKKGKNIGLIACLNYGFDIAKGKYVARMDGDDISHPQRLEKQVNFLQNNKEVIICGTWYQLLNTKKQIKLPEFNDEIKIALFDYCAIGHPTIMFNSNVVKDLHLKYSNDFEAAEDYELWCRIAFNGKFANLPEVLLYYRDHPDQVSLKKQKLQYDNSITIRKRLIEGCLDEVTTIDHRYSELIVTNTAPGNLLELKELLNWQNEILRLNKLALNVDLWKDYINLKKRNSIEQFYIHASKYNMDMLKHLFKFNVKNMINLGKKQNIKIALKCLLGWEKN